MTDDHKRLTAREAEQLEAALNAPAEPIPALRDLIEQVDPDRDVLAARLREDYLHDLPVEVTDKVFRKAWEDGHASGTHEVEQQYRELAEIVALAFDHGRNA